MMFSRSVSQRSVWARGLAGSWNGPYLSVLANATVTGTDMAAVLGGCQ